MPPLGATITLRYAIMGTILITAYFTVHSQTQNARDQRIREKVEEINQYINKKLHYGVSTMENTNQTTEIKLNLPRIETGYASSLECQEGKITINTETHMPAENNIETTNIKCSEKNISGEVSPGERCLIFKEGSEETKIEMVNHCGS